MSNLNITEEKTTQFGQKATYFSDKIPVTYLWFGDKVPEDYIVSISQMNYPVVFLKNPKLQRQFKRELLNIQKSDYYRLQYLYDHGGIYSDFDNVIDYQCLMRQIKPYHNSNQLMFLYENKFSTTVMNNFIFAPYPKMPVLKKIIDSLDQTKPKISGFAGITFLTQFQGIKKINLDKCVVHQLDYSWYEDSNKASGGNNQKPHKQFTEKSKTREKIIQQKQIYQMQAIGLGIFSLLLILIILILVKNMKKYKKLLKQSTRNSFTFQTGQLKQVSSIEDSSR